MLSKFLEKQEQAQPKTCRRKEVIQIRAKINKLENKTHTKNHESKSWFFEKMKKINKLLANLK
jgi:hypothetical protein